MTLSRSKVKVWLGDGYKGGFYIGISIYLKDNNLRKDICYETPNSELTSQVFWEENSVENNKTNNLVDCFITACSLKTVGI